MHADLYTKNFSRLSNLVTAVVDYEVSNDECSRNEGDIQDLCTS